MDGARLFFGDLDSGLCAAAQETRRRFATDLLNITLDGRPVTPINLFLLSRRLKNQKRLSVLLSADTVLEVLPMFLD